MHSPKFYKVKEYYDNGAWTESRVWLAVSKGWITEKEYEEIVGIKYEY